MTKDKEDKVMKRLQEGDFKVQGHFPEDVQVAVQSFLHASKMMVDEKLDFLPGEYLVKLLKVLEKYPEYNHITMDLVEAFMKER